MNLMSRHVFTAVLLASTAVACGPRHLDPNISDIDSDGVVDAFDQCMADPEDLDEFEDEDGCPERGGPDRSEASAKAMEPALKVRVKKIRRRPPQVLESKSIKASQSKYQSKAWGAVVDTAQRSALVFGFNKAWIKASGKTKLVKANVSRGKFSPNGKHVALVTDEEFLILDARSAKRIARFPYAAGTEDSTETKLIHLGAKGSVYSTRA